VLALHKLGIPLTVNPISFEDVEPELGGAGRTIKGLVGKKIDYNINVIHSTPEFWQRYKEAGKINVGMTIWETTKLHKQWPGYINENVDAVMVGCDWNIEVFKNSGVTIPIFSIPHCVDFGEFKNVKPFQIKGITDDTFVFYSIFQFIERKNPVALVKAYWYAFQNKENVALVLKTYRSNYKEEEKNSIRTTLKRMKQIMPMDNYPSIYLILDMLSNDEIYGLHSRGDCYASLDRGEGFGLNPFFAGALGNPIIVTGFGGSTEYAKPDNSYLVDYSLTPVSGMPWSPWYTGDQLWAESNVKHGSDLMKFVFNNQAEAKEKGLKLQKYIKNNFTYDVVGNKIINMLKNL
jgi:glycosyltransferase involved in cell wall biosynthesis